MSKSMQNWPDLKNTLASVKYEANKQLPSIDKMITKKKRTPPQKLETYPHITRNFTLKFFSS